MRIIIMNSRSAVFAVRESPEVHGVSQHRPFADQAAWTGLQDTRRRPSIATEVFERYIAAGGVRLRLDTNSN